MVAGAGSVYAPAERFENYPIRIDNRDLGQDNVSDVHGKKSQTSTEPELTK